ncbi:hypothetical protein RvY_11524-2 [Ramazzottius varieornatus]|uniref:Septin-type G domain-containing protein n=1 Tax=Ramazzottius varieornatus TaxID=947166 RepID=A0A1D1VGE0_RAMVA|nr:hypothetical protein RvY_11524-2 [Ramazzottius varieornatus]
MDHNRDHSHDAKYGLNGRARETVSSPYQPEDASLSSRGSPETEPSLKPHKKSKGFKSRVMDLKCWISEASTRSNGSNSSSRGGTLNPSMRGKNDWKTSTMPSRVADLTLRPTISSPLQSYAPPSSQGRVSTPSEGDGDGGGDSEMEVELSDAGGSGSGRHSVANEWKQDEYPSPIGIRREFRGIRAIQRDSLMSDAFSDVGPSVMERDVSQSTLVSSTPVNGAFRSSSRLSAPEDTTMLAAERMDTNHRTVLGDVSRNSNNAVDEYIDARSGSEESPNGNAYVDAEGIKVRKIKLVSSQNVGFESLPVQFVNKATKAGFVFNILVIGETGIGKSTLINSLFNYDFKLPPGDYRHDSVTLDKHTFQLEEGSVRLQLTIIETKGYGDQLNMADSCQGIVEYIDKQYEAYFQEESQVARRLSEYKDTRVHACIFLLAPTGSSVRALDLECMKLLANKVNIIPVIARGDSLTKKEMDTYKKKIREELQSHKINIYQFPEDDSQVADLNRRLNADAPFAVVGSSEVHDVAGHKARARMYPWGIVDIENEAHCDFTRFREALLRVNMDHLMQTTNLRHYETYRDRRMAELGYAEDEPQNFMETINRLRQMNEAKFRKKEEETRADFVNKVREKETELKQREQELHSQFEEKKNNYSDNMQEIQTQTNALQREMEIFHRVRSELVNQSGTIKAGKGKK